MEKPDLLHVENLNMIFGGIHALKDVSFEVERDSITALIGPNGAGKTTLFNCITGFYQATSGNITLNYKKKLNIRRILGEPFSKKHILHPTQFMHCLYYKMFGGSHLVARHGIARTFQNIRLFKEMTVIENLLVAQHTKANRNLISGLCHLKSYQKWQRQALDKAFYWLERFNLLEESNILAGNLPYGKQRHLEIARAMCTDPILICLDEPAAGLNPIETDKLSIEIKRLQKEHQITILLIEHDMNMVMNISDHIVVLDHGEVISQGDPSHIKNDKKVIKAYLGVEENAA